MGRYHHLFFDHVTIELVAAKTALPGIMRSGLTAPTLDLSEADKAELVRQMQSRV